MGKLRKIWVVGVCTNLLLLLLEPPPVLASGPCRAGCDDGLECTVDLCVDGACANTPVEGICSNNQFCDGQEVCHPKLGCQPGVPPCTGGCNEENDICLIAEPVGLVVVEKTSPAALDAGLVTYNLHVQFNGQNGNLTGVFFANISTNDPQGFYQNPMGGSFPPIALFCMIFPLMCSDTFVTIGCKDFDAPGCHSLAFGGTFTMGYDFIEGDWLNINYLRNSIGHPDDDLRVLIAQMTIHEGSSLSGALTVFSYAGSRGASYNLSFDTACPTDLHDDGSINAADLAILLGAWGPNAGHPADLNDDGVVNAADLAMLLGAWGPC